MAPAISSTLSLPSFRLPTSPPSSSFSSLSSSSSLFFSIHRPSTTLASSGLLLSHTATKNRLNLRRGGFSCNCLFGLGVPELVVIAGVAALVFGPKKLPEVGRSIGKTVKSFQQAAKEFESELKKEPDSAIEANLEKATEVSEEKEEDAKVSSSKESL